MRMRVNYPWDLLKFIRKQKLEYKLLQPFEMASISVGLMIEGMVKKQTNNQKVTHKNACAPMSWQFCAMT